PGGKARCCGKPVAFTGVEWGRPRGCWKKANGSRPAFVRRSEDGILSPMRPRRRECPRSNLPRLEVFFIARQQSQAGSRAFRQLEGSIAGGSGPAGEPSSFVSI